jgi:hypothetical protein
MTARLFFFSLLLANVLFFAWAQGYFGRSDDNREPQRLQEQLQADKLRIVRGTPAPAKRPDLACRMIEGLEPAEAETLKAAMKAGGAGEATVLAARQPKPHLVTITGLANKATAEKKLAELGRFGVTEHVTVERDGGVHEIVLGAFATEAEARDFLQGIVKRGIKSARVDSRELPPPKSRIEVRGPAEELLRQLPQLIAPYADATIGDCSS